MRARRRADAASAPRHGSCTFSAIRTRGKEAAMTSKQTEKEHLYDLLKGFDTAMLVTYPAGGLAHARPMAVAELRPDADTYFVTSIDSLKVEEIEANPSVTLTFQSTSKFASLS